MITLQGFLNMIIGPSFTWVHVMDPLTYKELSRGYVDDLLKEHTQFIQKFEVVSFYTVREVLYINSLLKGLYKTPLAQKQNDKN